MSVLSDTREALLFQELIDQSLHDCPNAKGILMHVEAPDFGISWTGVAKHSGESTSQSITAEHPATIASITKIYVAGAVLRLIEQGHFGLHDAIARLLPLESAAMLSSGGYDLTKIEVAHLLSNTSGIFDYVNSPAFQKLTTSNQSYHWTRKEQIELAVKDGSPLAGPGEHFSYADTNFLLLTGIIEKFTKRPFHTAMRELLRYAEFDIKSTWFPILEEDPSHLPPRIKQFATGYKVNSHDLHPTFDLFGGGGIVSTTRDVAVFAQRLFEGRIFDKPETCDLLLEEVQTQDNEPSNYHMGVAKIVIDGTSTFGHGGFFGSMVKYVPDLNCSVAIFLLERDEWPLNVRLVGEVCKLLRSLRN